MVKLKPLWSLLQLLLLLVLVLFIFTSVWLAQGPKSLDWAKPFVLERLNAGSAPYTVHAGHIAVDWRNLTRLGMARVTQVRLTAANGEVVAALPEMFVSLDLLGFLPGRRILNHIYVQRPTLYLTRDKQKQLRLGLQGGEGDPTYAAMEAKPPGARLKPWSGALPFRQLRVEKLHLVVSDELLGRRLTSTDASLLLGRRFGRYYGRLDLPFTYGDEKGALHAELRATERDRHRLDLTLDEVPTDYSCVFSICPGGLELAGIIDGEVAVAFDGAMRPLGAQGELALGEMRVSAPEWLAEPLDIKRGSIRMRAGDAMDRLEISELDVTFSDTRISGHALAEKKRDGWYISGHARSDKLPIGKLYKYWPLGLASDSRAWVTSSLSVGHGEDSTIDFNFTPADFANPNIRREALSAVVHARGLTVHYLPGFPDMQQVDGLVNFTGDTIHIAASSGTLLTGTSIRDSAIIFSDLNIPATPMRIDLQLTAPARDAASLLALKHFTFDDGLQLDPARITGQVEGALKLRFDAFSADNPDTPVPAADEVNFDNVGYDVDLVLKDVAQPGFAGALDIVGGSGTLKADNEGMGFDGAVKLGPVTLVNVKVAQKSGGDVSLVIDGGIARSEFAALGLPDDRRFGEGTLRLTADLLALKDDIKLARGTVDLSDMAFSIPEISWQKRRGAEAAIEVAPQGDAYRLDIRAPGLSAPGSVLSFGPGMALREVHLPRVRTDNSDFGLRYTAQGERFEARLSGNTLDASMSYTGEGEQGTENSLLADFPRMKLDVDLGALVLVASDPLTQVKGTLDCRSGRCESAQVSARAGDSDIRASIGREAGQRRFLLTASDAGSFLRTLDITDRMHGGALTLEGTYDDSVAPPALPAKLSIRKFTLKNSQILGRILSIGSLTGLANALTGSGIAFEKLEGDIHSQGGIITVKEGKASGNAIGISIAGTVDTNKSTFNMKGVLVPAAMLNTIFSKIPLIGMLAGGDEGLIAFNFSVKGPQSDPSVMVNPFSGLTPGFLRGIWGNRMPDEPSEGAAEEEAPGRRHQRGIGD